MEFCNIELKESIKNKFGESIDTEPRRIPEDNWARGRVATVKQDSASTSKIKMRSLTTIP